MKVKAHDPNDPPHPSWFPVFAPIVAWGLHLIVSVVTTVHGCRIGSAALVRGIVLGTGLLALVFAAAGLLMTGVVARHVRPRSILASEGRTPDKIIPLVGRLSSITFGVAVLLDTVPMLLLGDPCEAGR